MGAAFANGGNEKDVQPGLDFFKQLNDSGNLNPTGLDIGKVQKGEVALGIGWDYLGLGWRDQLVGQVNLDVLIPEDGTTVGPYVSIINQWAPHPHAARLMRNFILSPEGQVLYAKGYATPILPSVEIPEEIQAKRPPAEAYAVATPIEDWPAAVAAFQMIADSWGNEVLGQ
jgi:putative spermidine/putrescine transport system substrate-binding protein